MLLRIQNEPTADDSLINATALGKDKTSELRRRKPLFGARLDNTAPGFGKDEVAMGQSKRSPLKTVAFSLTTDF